jgi:SAM-dependent methyltransferase
MLTRSEPIKTDPRSLIDRGEKVNLDLGCGRLKRPGWIGIDRVDLPEVDIVADLEDGLPFLADNSVDEINAHSFLEHIHNFETLMREMHRVLKPDGRLLVFVPHFSNPYYYSDYTHTRFFGLYSFDYFSSTSSLRRRVPNHYSDIRFRVLSRKLVFDSPFGIRHAFKKLCQHIFNASTFTQELYEENLCYIFPCYAIEFVLAPDR